MDYFLIADGFVRRFCQVMTSLRLGRRDIDITKTEIQAVLEAAVALQRQSKSKASLSSMEYTKDTETTHLKFDFDSDTAREVRDAAQAQLVTIEAQAHELREHVLMQFVQTNIKNRKVGSKKTGEQVRIEKIDPRPISIIYASDLSRDRISAEKRRFGRSLFDKAFDVDVYIERALDGRPIAYRIVAVHEVIDLPDESAATI